MASLNSTVFGRTHAVLQRAVESGVAPGFVAAVWWGEEQWISSYGQAQADTVFDLASLTKIIATAPLAARLVDRGWWSWEMPVQALIPEYKYTQIKLKHLLSHTSGLRAWEPFWQKLRDGFKGAPLESIPIIERQRAMRELVLSSERAAEPGMQTVYSDLGPLIVGFMVEETLQRPFDEAVAEWVWGPMGVRGLSFCRVFESAARSLHKNNLKNIAPTEDCPWRGAVLKGQVHDDNCWAMGGYGGHAGVFGSAQALIDFMRAIRGGFLSRQIRSEMWTRARAPKGCERTMGWDTPAAEGSSVGRYFPRNFVGHLGFTGTSLWMDPDSDFGVVLLSNRVHPSRESPGPAGIKTLRPEFHEAVSRDLCEVGLEKFCG